jgi:hypothetical protein
MTNDINKTNKNKQLFLIIFLFIIILVVVFSYFFTKYNRISTPILSFDDCARAGYPVIETYPRQCKTPDGLTFAEEIPERITYYNASDDLIKLDLPFPGAVVGKDFAVIGEARGAWFFEASFPVEVLDRDAKSIAIGIAQAQGEWMTEDFVPFRADIKVPETYIGPATLILKKDNPSGLAENDASIILPINIEY